MNIVYLIVLPISIFLNIQCEAQFHLSNAILPQKMHMHFAGIYNETFTVFGGKDSTQSFITESLSASVSFTFNISAWNLNTVTMPLGITGLYTYSKVTINENIYIINPYISGGSAVDQHGMFIYNLATNGYTVSVTPTYSVAGACAVHNSDTNIIYTLGGNQAGVYRKHTQRFNISSNTWLSLGGNTVYFKSYAGCSFDAANSYIFYFGGYGSSSSPSSPSYLNAIEKYSVSDDGWTPLSATLTSSRYALKCRLSIDNNIYCIGGINTGTVFNTVDVFRPTTETIIGTWYLNEPRTYVSATLWNDASCLIVAGGYDGSSYLDSIETFGDCTAPTQSPTANSAPPSKAPTSFIEAWSENNKFIWIGPDAVDWTTANNFCKNKYNTSLASIHSDAENIEISNLCSSHSGTWCFIGLNDIDIEGVYVWIDGTDIDYTPTLWSNNNAGGEPGEDCQLILPSYLGQNAWGDTGCSAAATPYTFICNAPPTMAPSSAPTNAPSSPPSTSPSKSPTMPPTLSPSSAPTNWPSFAPSNSPTTIPTLAPSTAPTFTPSVSPSEAPTMPPTLAPISSCVDYDGEFSNDGDVQFEFLDEYTPLNQPLEYVLTVSAESDIECENNNDCFIPCNDMLSCSFSSIVISNSTDKQVVVYCGDIYSCSDLSISVKSMVSMLNLTVVCNADYSCINMNIFAADFNSLNVYCSASSSCLDVNVNITVNGNDTEFENDGIISCISENSCDHMMITTDSVDTQLKMYAHSDDVTLDNKYGYIPFHDHQTEANIVCNDRFIRYETSLVTQPIINYVETSILNGYGINSLNTLPCSGVSVKCDGYSCQMVSTLNVPDFVVSDLETDCYWLKVQHFLDWQCEGQCVGSPTETPTNSPSKAPSEYTYPPTAAPTAAPSNHPTETPTNAPSDSPSFAPSSNPTVPPTQAPTRYPTLNMHEMYDSVIKITYILEGLTISNINKVVYNTMDVISDIIEFIERSYFIALNGLFQIEYRDFAVLINDINGHDLSNIYLKLNEQIRLNGIILVNKVDSDEIIETSKTNTFSDAVKHELILYFSDNQNVIFTVEDSDHLHILTDEKERNSSLAVIYISAFIIFCGFGFSAYILYGNKKANSVIDNAKYLAPLLFSLQIYDLLSDINLSFDILTNPLAHSGDYKSNMIFYCGIASVVFTVIPYFTNLLYAIKIKTQQVIRNNNRADTYFTDRVALFIGLVVVSGGCYPSLLLCSSRMLNLDAFTSGLTRYELSQLTQIKIKSTITLENGPQLIIQIVYVLLTTSSTISPAVFLAFVGSSLSILMAVASYCANKESSKNAEFVSYFMRFVNSDNTDKLTDEQKNHIKQKKERKSALQKLIATAFGTSHENIEIGFSKIINNGLEMHIIHFVPGSEKEKFIEQINSGFMGVGYQRFLTAKQYVMARYNEINDEMNDAVREHFEINQQSFIVAFDDENIAVRDKEPLIRRTGYNTNKYRSPNQDQGTVEMMELMSKDIKDIKEVIYHHRVQKVNENDGGDHDDDDGNGRVNHIEESGENDGNVTTNYFQE